ELVLYQVHEGVEFPESQDDQFSGRVQIDTDVLREGRIRLHVSRLRTEDSGLYLCVLSRQEILSSVCSEIQIKRVALFPLPGHEPIHAKVGDDVTLPCHVKPPFDVNSLTIEWRFKDKKIYVHRSGAKDDETTDPNYKGRISLFYDEFEKGNISLKLTEVTKEDEGNYTCFVPKLQSQVNKGYVTLKVGELSNIKIIYLLICISYNVFDVFI
uniref:Ig-like domain-containing protein n=1 Tax=Poecilia formosa TaxID=48698 RepID=A0A096MIE8_POEFO